MKENMKYIVKRAEEIDKVSEAEAQISQVKTIALDNIHKVREQNVKCTVQRITQSLPALH